MWADGKPLDLTGITDRIIAGDEGQTPDPLIVAKEAHAPAYRGLAYVVFERLPLAEFRQPHSAALIRGRCGRSAGSRPWSRAVTLIPGTTEFGYEPADRRADARARPVAPENRHVGYAPRTSMAALDELQASARIATDRGGRRLVRHRSARRPMRRASQASSRRPSRLSRGLGRSPASTVPTRTWFHSSTAARPMGARRPIKRDVI